MFRTGSIGCAQIFFFRKVHVLVHEAPEKAANTREKAPNAALPLTYTVGQPHDAARVAAQAAD